MPVPYPDTIVADLGLETSNSYCDVAYADSYFENHFSSAKSTTWAALTDAQKTQVLIQACWTIEQLRFTIPTYFNTYLATELQYNTITGRFTGYVNRTMEAAKYFYNQMLQFPRNKDITSEGVIYIPDRVMKAQCEQALYLISFDDTAMSNAAQGISMDAITVDKIKLTQEYTNGQIGNTLAPLALDYLKPYLIYNQRIKRS